MEPERPPLPPFTRVEDAESKVRLAENAWNSRDPDRVKMAYSVGSRWRNRAEFLEGRDAIAAFLARKWARELDYRLVKELFAVDGARIAVRFAYEWRERCFAAARSEEKQKPSIQAIMLIKSLCIFVMIRLLSMG